jgi:hypothetical protein
MSSAADRMRAHRQRAEAGRALLRPSVHLDRLALALGEDGFLRDWDDTETDPTKRKAAITAALEKMIETYVIDLLGDA